MPGGEISPATDAVFTTWPSPWATKRGTKARTPWITPQRLTPSAHCQSAAVFSHRGPTGETPALLQTTCTSFREAANASTSDASETSTRRQKAPFASRAVSSRPFSSTSARARCMPSFANASAMARPRPLAAPVTAAVLPRRVFIVVSFESVPGEPLARLAPERVAELLAEKTEMADPAHAEVRGRHVPHLGRRSRVELEQLLHRAEGTERVVAEGVGAQRRGEAGVGVLDAQRADEISRVAAPARPFDRHPFRQVLAEAEARAREIAEQPRDAREGDVRHRPHPRPGERRPVAPIAALRADDQRRGDALRFRQEAERLAAEAVADDADLRERGKGLHRRRRVEQHPVAHPRAHRADVPLQRLADAAIVEGQDPESLGCEPRREPGVVALRHARRRKNQHRLARFPAVERRAQPVTVGGGERHLHELTMSERPPIRISDSMNRTCRWACMRVTSQAATALPGMVAAPMTMPVKNASLSSSAKRWKSAAL